MPLNIIIAEDDENLANSLSRDCEKVQDIRVVATVQNGKRLVQLAMEMNPEVVITDIKMPGISGIQAARRIREYNPDIDIIFLTAYEDFV
ncbi:MAG: response regulator, partial [Thermosediminibacteraceae bacterium]|nr:response regulator [Thermosediminibacteraceae bacterium]